MWPARGFGPVVAALAGPTSTPLRPISSEPSQSVVALASLQCGRVKPIGCIPTHFVFAGCVALDDRSSGAGSNGRLGAIVRAARKTKVA